MDSSLAGLLDFWENNSVPGWDALEGGKVRSCKAEDVFPPATFGDGDF